MIWSPLPLIVGALFYCITTTPANAQSLFDPKAVEGLLGNALQGLQKELDKHKSEEATEPDPVEEKRKKKEAAELAEEKRKKKEAAKLAEEKTKKKEAAKLAEEKRKKEEEVISKEVDRSITNFVKAYTMKLNVEKTIQEAETAFQDSTELADRIESWIKKDNLAP